MSIISNAKELAELIKKVGDIELYRRIVELEGEIIELTRNNRELEEQLQKIKKQSNAIEKLTRKNSFYFLDNDNDPYCPYCVEVEQLAVHLHKTTKNQWRASYVGVSVM